MQRAHIRYNIITLSLKKKEYASPWPFLRDKTGYGNQRGTNEEGGLVVKAKKKSEKNKREPESQGKEKKI